MKTSRYCSECNRNTTHYNLGFLPTLFTRGNGKDTWEKSAMCMECGQLLALQVDEEELSEAHDRYLRNLVRLGVMTKEELEEELQ